MSLAASDLSKAFNRTDLDALYKIHYKEMHEETMNTSTPTWNRIAKTSDFTGKKLEFPVPQGWALSAGSGSLPETVLLPLGDVQIEPKKMYATGRIDRESIMASLNDKGAFVKLLTENARQVVEADKWNHNRAFFGDGTGKLGTTKASGAITDNTGGNFSVIVGEGASTFKEANFEENMLVNFGTGTDKFKVVSVTPSTRTIVVQRQAGGSDVPAVATAIYMQGSKDNDIMGLKILDLTSTTAYGVAVGRRWKAYNELLAYNAALSVEVMNKAMIGVEKQCGQVPDTIVTSYAQYEKILNFLEDKKRFSLVDVPAKGSKASLSYSGVKFQSSRGAIDIFPDKFCEDDRMYFLNSKHIKYYRRPQSGWVKDDIGGNGYLRVAGEDQFEARHATYGQIFIALPFHGVVDGLTV